MLLNVLGSIDLPRASDLSKKQLYALIIAYGLISLPMMQLFPLWINVMAIATIAIKLASMQWRFTVPKWIAFLLLVIGIMLIAFNFSQLGKEYASVALLFIFASLKLLEAKEQRDAFLLMLINLLLIMGALMAQQSPFAFVYLIGCFLYNIYIQMRIAQPEHLQITWRQNLKAILKILLTSLPFVLVLFFFFPRIEPLWQQPGPPKATTGLSEEMSPNSLSSLAQDGGLAFRVKFKNNQIPKSDLLYWRGPVLIHFDGKTWRREKGNRQPPKRFNVDKNSAVNYTLFHDGSTSRWLVPLDLPGQIDTSSIKTYINTDFELGAATIIAKPTAFNITSYTSYNTGNISKLTYRLNTFLPPKLYPKTRQLAQQIRANSNSNEAFAENLWQYFRDNTFYYDLEPPVGNSNIDTFLFDNQVGYCEHYSSAFVFMLRSQGVPSRIVTGYQGGERNPVSGDFEVKQLNAHAWAEVYIENKGWVRYDPTAAVAPERINRGSPFGSARNTESLAAGSRLEHTSGAYKRLSNTLRAMNAFWQNWIIDYGNEKQQSLWDKLGLSSLKYFAWLILLAILIPLVLLFIWLYRRYKRQHVGDVVSKAMRPFMRYLNKQGITRKPYQPMTAFIEQYASQLGESKKYADQVVTHYYELRYSKGSDLEQLKKSIQRFIQRHKLLSEHHQSST